MDLVNLMKSMSVNDTEENSTSNCHVFAVTIGENHTDIVFGDFTNQYMVIATQHEKIGSLLKVSKEQPVDGYSASEPVYTISIIFGAENIEQQAAARHIAEKLDIQKPLMLFLCLKNYEVSTVKSLVDALLNIPNKDN